MDVVVCTTLQLGAHRMDAPLQEELNTRSNTFIFSDINLELLFQYITKILMENYTDIIQEINDNLPK